ncbi:Hypothetical protein, putative [Bodo saltans]|uniref:Uncharacterized protein n=1 Tax=Bodo saltans TaxID=75058 RepID=A0A0S4J0S7_BODSA|nr:Hypothetical protein, putative [Bodo saltans]|eukprot:CUG23543.1 Hypothetical protein, putative [Bodo saltans]
MDSSNSVSSRAAQQQPPVLDNAVVFLFAHQQLVFRYPLLNPFEVAPSYLKNKVSLNITGGTDGDHDSHGLSSAQAHQGGGGGPVGLSGPCAGPASTSSTATVAAKMPSCVGLETSTIVFLLRNSYSRLTTIRIGMCSFLIWPLYGVKGEATLVVALGQADDAYSHVARFVQVCVNVLLREETRCGHVTSSIDVMLAAIEAAGAPRSSTAAVDTSSITVPSAATQRRGAGARSSHAGASDAAAATVLQSTGVGELDAMDRAAHAAQGGLFVELRLMAETINGQYHQDIVINQLLVVPHSHMSGHVRHRRQVVASFSSRFHSGSVVTIADPYFSDTRRQQYEHVVGKDIVDLLPLDDIERLMLQLAPPWTLFSLRSGLERRLTERILMNRSNSSNSGDRPPSSSARYTPPSAGGSGVDDVGGGDSSVYSVQDAPFIVFEIIEFLRLFGAITIHIQRLAMTRGRLANLSRSEKVSPLSTPQRGGQGGGPVVMTCPSLSNCILGATCVDCEIQINAEKAAQRTTSPMSGDGSDHNNHSRMRSPTLVTERRAGQPSPSSLAASSTEVQHQLLYRHYSSVYDDPWFVASEVEHRVLESNLEIPHNKHPSLRVFEKRFEPLKSTTTTTTATQPPLPSATVMSPTVGGAHAVLHSTHSGSAPQLFPQQGLQSPLSSSLNATRTSVDLDPTPTSPGPTQAPPPLQDASQWKEQVIGIHSPTDVPPAAAAWLFRHSAEIRRRAGAWLRSTLDASSGTAQSAPMLLLGGADQPFVGRRHQRTDSTQDGDGSFVIDSQGSLTRRKIYEIPRKDVKSPSTTSQQQQRAAPSPPSIPFVSQALSSSGGGAAAPRAPPPLEYVNDPRLLPDETLLRLVVHLVVAFLWQAGDEVSSVKPSLLGADAGGEDGLAGTTSRADHLPPNTPARRVSSARSFPSMEDLTAKVEWSLRHIAPTLRNMSYARLRQEAVTAHEKQHHQKEGEDVAQKPLPSPPPPLTIAERKILEMTAAIEALHLLDDVKPFAGREIRRVPCRRLVHIAVNLIPDVVSVVLMPSKLPSAAAI